jgi:predicted rRNA methylase YqxC with S4 and FtsJ domains
VKDSTVWERTVLGVIDAFSVAGAAMMGVMISPIRGTDGNVEFLGHFVLGKTVPVDETSAAVARTIAEVA